MTYGIGNCGEYRREYPVERKSEPDPTKSGMLLTFAEKEGAERFQWV